jgi:ribosome-associated protein
MTTSTEAHMETTPPKKVTKRSLPVEVRTAVKAAQSKKGEDICVLDLRTASTFTDYFLIMEGNSSRQNAALADAIGRAPSPCSSRPIGVEGTSHGEWILMDFGFLVVHVFSRTAREYYGLEKLWGDAPKFEY